MELTYFEPKVMLENIESKLNNIPNEEVFNNPKHQKLLEAWCAAMFATGYSKHINKCTVAINETKLNTEADFYIKTPSHNWPFQLTEVQSKGRKRGKEFKDKTTKLTPYKPMYENEHAIEWIHEGINKKHLKHYSGSENLNLLVYVNFAVGDLKYQDVVNGTKEFSDKFSSIWLLTNTHLCSLVSNKELGILPGWGEARSIEEYYV